MAQAVEGVLEERISRGMSMSNTLTPCPALGAAPRGGPPYPDAAGGGGRSRIADLLGGATEKTWFVSDFGGGSAMMTLPVVGVTLATCRR